jgi:peptidyl-prolyl cis-trans isomerase A (cyclophilin A)
VIALLLALAVAAPLSAAGPAAPLPRVTLRTSLGDIVVEIDVARAPATARNFLRYVDAGRYGGGGFHRTVTTAPDNQPSSPVKIDVVQAGPAPGQEFPPIPLERTRDTGLLHVDGAISMARDGPDTATADFFLCVGPQPSLDFGGRRNPDGQGFAVFGRVVSGMEVVRRIHEAPAKGQSLQPPIRILDATRFPP